MFFKNASENSLENTNTWLLVTHMFYTDLHIEKSGNYWIVVEY